MYHDRTVLITGASSGIGAELAKQAAADGADVVLTARREQRLEDLAETLEKRHDVMTIVIPKDLSDPAAPTELFQEVQSKGIRIHTLVNNAGISAYGRFDKIGLDEELDRVQINVTAATHLAKLFVQPMIDRGDGAILNVSSLSAYYPLPMGAVYGGTKAYLLSFSRALARELGDEGVTVTVLCPGIVETEILEKHGVDQSGMSEGIVNDPESVAKAGWKGLKAGKRTVEPALSTKLFAQLPRILPRRTATAIAENSIENGVSYLPL